MVSGHHRGSMLVQPHHPPPPRSVTWLHGWLVRCISLARPDRRQATREELGVLYVLPPSRAGRERAQPWSLCSCCQMWPGRQENGCGGGRQKTLKHTYHSLPSV